MPLSELLIGLTDAEIEAGISPRTNSIFELPVQNPRTGQLLSRIQTKENPFRDIQYHVNMRFRGIKGAPGKFVEIHYPSEDPKAPFGSYSSKNPTIQINSKKPELYRLDENTWKVLDANMTPEERDLAHIH